MRTIQTRDFGELQAPDNSEIIFKKPIFGFEQLTEYYLIPLPEPEEFFVLQSKEDVDVAFTLTRPHLFLSDYLLDIDDKDATLLEFESHEELLDFAILTIPEATEDITMNLLGPLIINMKNGYAVQAISNCSHYTTKCRLFHVPEKETKQIS